MPYYFLSHFLSCVWFMTYTVLSLMVYILHDLPPQLAWEISLWFLYLTQVGGLYATHLTLFMSRPFITWYAMLHFIFITPSNVRRNPPNRTDLILAFPQGLYIHTQYQLFNHPSFSAIELYRDVHNFTWSTLKQIGDFSDQCHSYFPSAPSDGVLTDGILYAFTSGRILLYMCSSTFRYIYLGICILVEYATIHLKKNEVFLRVQAVRMFIISGSQSVLPCTDTTTVGKICWSRNHTKQGKQTRHSSVQCSRHLSWC